MKPIAMQKAKGSHPLAMFDETYRKQYDNYNANIAVNPSDSPDYKKGVKGRKVD